jgi:protein TonB
MIALSRQDRRELIRWAACGAVVMFAHAGVAAALIQWREPAEEGEVGTDAIVVEFQPEQKEIDPTPVPVEKVEEKEEPLPEQQSEAMLPPKPEVQPEPPQEEPPPPPPPPQPARAVASVASWRSQIVTILEHNKRYPSEARARGEQGVTRLAFSIDAQGHLLTTRIVKSSGSAALDAETLALVQRVQPFPPPPPELAGSEMTVPFSFNIR